MTPKFVLHMVPQNLLKGCRAAPCTAADNMSVLVTSQSNQAICVCEGHPTLDVPHKTSFRGSFPVHRFLKPPLQIRCCSVRFRDVLHFLVQDAPAELKSVTPPASCASWPCGAIDCWPRQSAGLAQSPALESMAMHASTVHLKKKGARDDRICPNSAYTLFAHVRHHS